MRSTYALRAVFIVGIFLMATEVRPFFTNWLSTYQMPGWTYYMLGYGFLLGLPLLASLLLFGAKGSMPALGLWASPVRGFALACVMVLPMFLGAAITSPLSPGISWFDAIRKTFLAGFVEEFLFRGFLFGLLFRYCGWGFLPAGLLGALFFGLGHLYQGNTPLETIGIFMVTALGGLWFGWLYIMHRGNLWLPIFLHGLMNLSWYLFSVSHNALGGIGPNLFRGLTIALSIWISIRLMGKGVKFWPIGKNNLLINKGNSQITDLPIAEKGFGNDIS
ncbi:MAG: CPBP family intramembrane metalloprotease [Bacteroidetes bacterium]|jgi:membrane protease YdiL (CAAX protease family)|nr:CPBP family intramembrane metalloprotease [Bacteroidota bacterium]